MIRNFICAFVSFSIILGCGSKNETISEKLENKLERAEEKAKEAEEKAKEKAKEIEKKMASPKKSAPVEIGFELKGSDLLIVTVNLNKPVSNLVVQANPLDGLEIEPVAQVAKTAYDIPTVLTLNVSLKTNVGRLGIYIAGSFEGRQLATSQTYDFNNSKKQKKNNPPTEIDGNGDVIRVMKAEEK